jgi:hypothetical protein
MTHYFALLSIVFMISFVALFDVGHLARINSRFCKDDLMGGPELDRLQRILAACSEA